ncbi:MAG: hypothetical protein AB8H86_22450 [Polyangiales bacterium]
MRRALLACALLLVSTQAFAQDGETEVSAEVDPEVSAEVDAENTVAETNVTAEGSADAAPDVPDVDEPAARAKFALVIVGDADAVLQTRASDLSQALHDAGLTSVHDDAIREALLGGGTDEDGLGPLRGARRTLSLSDDAGARSDALERIGRASGADTLVLVARRAPTLRVYDLTARSFYQAVPASPDDVPYIASATRAAAARALTAPALVAEAAEEAEAEVDADEELPPVRAFFRKNWPYMVAAVLLAGAIVWLVVGAGSDDEAPPPVLRFRPGSAE